MLRNFGRYARVPCLNATRRGIIRSTQTQAQQPRGIRQGTLFGLLACTGLGVTIYTVLEYYSLFREWPEDIRNDVRLGIKFKHVGDFDKSIAAFTTAIEKGRNLSDESYKQMGVSKTIALTGLQISLSNVYELANTPQNALAVLQDALSSLLALESPSSSEQHRSIALSQKMGDLCLRFGQQDAAEKYYEWGIEQMLKIGLKMDKNSEIKRATDGEVILVHELELPNWVSKSDLGASLERLAGLFAERGRPADAVPLYVQTISLLLPPKEKRTRDPTSDERCRAGLLMSNLSQVLTTHPSTKNLKTALSWADKSVDIVENAVENTKRDDKRSRICDHTLAVGLFNLGVLNEMLKNSGKAKEQYTKAIAKSEEIGLLQGKLQAKDGLRRINNNN
ncbi:hypothetical protein E3Q17_01052 [Wallemia mellicola]|uniref:TPR-like protein n=1 Tax=Wallemia mellicola TaxID=1708541 RepID=A0A4T0NZF5_9BASI|nr:hypothetical protein E3Q17_01052 [Wallemia mellicola]